MSAGFFATGKKFLIMKRLFGLFVFLLLVLTACSGFQSYRSAGYAPVISGGHGVNYWLSELHDTRKMSPEQLQQTLESREQEFHQDPGTGNRLRLVLLLAAGDEPVNDPQRALELLDAMNTLPDNPSDRELIVILQHFLYEQVMSNRKIGELTQQVTRQKTRIEELEQQQKALTTIEQSIQEREKPSGTDNGN
jgi:hypothetical protein